MGRQDDDDQDLDNFEFADDGAEVSDEEPDEGDEELESDEGEEPDEDDEADEEEESESEEEQEATPAEKGAGKKDSQKSVDDDDAPEWARKAVQTERRKRQQERAERERLEKEVAYLKGRVDSKTPKAEEAEEEIDYSDIPGYVKKVRERDREKHKAEAQREAQEAFDIRAEAAEELARQRHEDFDDVIEDFKELAAKDPAVRRKVFHAPDPAEYAYQYAKSRNTRSHDDEIAALKKQVAALSKKKTSGEEPRGNPRQSLARARGAGPTVARNKGRATNDKDFFSGVFTKR